MGANPRRGTQKPPTWMVGTEEQVDGRTWKVHFYDQCFGGGTVTDFATVSILALHRSVALLGI